MQAEDDSEAGYWAGRTILGNTREVYAVSVADFVAYTDAELDTYAWEAGKAKPQSESRPAAPTRLEEWESRVRRQIDIWCLTYGEEWREVKTKAAKLLATWHTSAPHQWPLTVLMDCWEELHWRFTEELKEILRSLKREAGRETMTLNEVKFHALMPDSSGYAWLQLPNTFDLEDPNSWFATEVKPRIERKQDRALWRLTWEGPGKRDRGAPAGAREEEPQKSEKPTLKTLWGPKLTPEEVTRARERAPTDREGKLLCWGFLTHMGCNMQGCQRSHEQLRGAFEALDPAVQMQLLRRGGLKRMKMDSKEKVAEKIKAIRAATAADKASKIKDGVRRAGQEPAEEPGESRAGGSVKQVSFEVPAALRELDFTKAEHEISDLIKGPDATWVEETAHQQVPHPGRDGNSAPKEAWALVEKAEEMASGPVLSALQDASDDLYAWAAARVAQDPAQELQPLMEEMATFGLGDIAAEASMVLEKLDHRRAGEVGRMEIGEIQWPADERYPGHANVKIDGQAWSMLDYREEIPMSDCLASLVKVPEPQDEKRQCVTRVLAAGTLQRQLGRPPNQEEVDQKAEEMRREHCYQAIDAAEQLGEAEEFVAAVEHELRTYVHDILTPHHEKDFRSLAVFPLTDLQEAKLVVLRADYRGDLLVETVVGSQWRTGGWHIWALISRGHMTLLQPPANWDATAWLKKEERFSTPALGFSFFYHQRHDQSRTAPGKVHCRLCKGSRRAGEGPVEAVLRRHSCLAAVAALAGGSTTEEPCVRRAVRATADTLNFKELFAGHAVLTAEWVRQGGRAMEPVEVFEQPHFHKGYRAEHDLLRVEVQEQHLLAARQGPENVAWIASPCTSFCDWGLQNGGTRTFDRPRGDEGGRITQKEEDGNRLSEFGAAYFEALLDNGGFPMCESTAPSGRYPKQWHLPAWKAVLQRPDVDYVDLDMCAFGLGPPDVAGQFYRHATRVVFPRHEPLRRALLRTCPGVSADHVHVPLKGNRPGVPVSRCTEAGVYAQDFVKTVVTTLFATLTVGGAQAVCQGA